MMVIVIENSNHTRVRMSCENFGEYKHTNFNRIRNNTKKTNCPFLIEGYRVRVDKKTKEGKWGGLSVIVGHHNHALATSFVGHSFIGRMTSDQKDLVRRWTDMRMKPRLIETELRHVFPENVTSVKQINNFRQQLQFEDIGDLTVTQWTLTFLNNEGYKYFTRREKSSGEVDILMFANPTSLHLLKLFPYVVAIDATYKTNRYAMHLVEMVGFSSTGKTFNIAFAFTKGEDIDHYMFIIQRLERLYSHVGKRPTAVITDRDNALINAINQVFGDTVKHLLCWVHIKQNIRAYALVVTKEMKSAEDFANTCWGLFLSCTEKSYSDRLQVLREKWHKGLVGYVERTWLDPFKENIVRAWTDLHLHFFTRTTNRVEGMHKKLKDDLESCRYGFNSIIRTMHHSLERQCENVRASMEMSRTKVPSEVHYLAPFIKPLFEPLFNKVTEKCMKMLLDFYYAILDGKITSECNDYWWRTCQGIPCKHRIANAMMDNTPIMPSEVHQFWRQLTWEEVTTEVDYTIPLAVHHVVFRKLTSDYAKGEMSEDSVFEVASLYEGIKTPHKSSLKVPKDGIPKANSKCDWDGAHMVGRREHWR